MPTLKRYRIRVTADDGKVLYEEDGGVPDCGECQREFGPDRSQAIAVYNARLRMQTRVTDAPAITRHHFAAEPKNGPAHCRCGSRIEAHLYRDAKEFEREQNRQSVEWP